MMKASQLGLQAPDSLSVRRVGGEWPGTHPAGESRWAGLRSTGDPKKGVTDSVWWTLHSTTEREVIFRVKVMGPSRSRMCLRWGLWPEGNSPN